eukprot:g1009.t1
MPTNCGDRPECAGCGELCFPQHPPNDPHFSTLVNTTGLSEQSNSPFNGNFPPQATRSAPVQCQPTNPDCIRGNGALTLHKFKDSDPESGSNEACCTACIAMVSKGAKAWQMITKKGTPKPECWCMANADVKSPSPDSCVSAATTPPPPPGQKGGLLRSADIVLSWDQVETSEGVLDWTSLKTAIDNARGSGGVLTVLFWTGIWGPNWMYTANQTNDRPAVPVIASTDGSGQCAKLQSCCPDYRDPTYQSLLRDRHIALANELRSLDALGNVVVGFQPCVGSTGDDTPIHLDKQWTVLNASALSRICGDPKCAGKEASDPNNWWHNFTRAFAHTLATDKALFGGEIISGNFALLLNAQGDSFGGLGPTAKQFPGSFLKFGQAGHEYQSNYERYRAAQHAPYVYALQTPLPAAASTAERESEAEAPTDTSAPVILVVLFNVAAFLLLLAIAFIFVLLPFLLVILIVELRLLQWGERGCWRRRMGKGWIIRAACAIANPITLRMRVDSPIKRARVLAQAQMDVGDGI